MTEGFLSLSFYFDISTMFGQSQGNIIYLRLLINILNQPFSRPLAGIIFTIVAFSCIKALVGKFDLATGQVNVITGSYCDQKYYEPWSSVLYTKVHGNRISGSKGQGF